MIENINELAKFVKGGAEVLQKAIESKENVSIELVEGSFVSDGDLDSLKNERFNAGKKEGQTIGYDFAMKDLKKDFSLDLEGKNRDEIVKAINEKILHEANKKPDAKIAELSSSIENLRKTYESEKSTWETQESSYKKQLKDISIMSELQKEMPEVKGLTRNQFAVLARQVYDFDFDENGTFVAKKGDTILKDKMEKPIPAKNVLTDFAVQNGWFGTEGRGAGDGTSGNGQSKFESMNDVMKHMFDNKINPMSDEGQKMMQEFKNSKN